MPRLEHRLDLPGVTRERLWAFHLDPRALVRLTPPGKRLVVVSFPERMGEGARVVLRVRQMGVPLTWVSRIEEWDEPNGFADVQESGPFRAWRHRHLFEDGRLTDRVEYEVPLARLGGGLVDRLLIRPDLDAMFAHRHAVTREALLGG